MIPYKKFYIQILSSALLSASFSIHASKTNELVEVLTTESSGVENPSVIKMTLTVRPEKKVPLIHDHAISHAHKKRASCEEQDEPDENTDSHPFKKRSSDLSQTILSLSQIFGTQHHAFESLNEKVAHHLLTYFNHRIGLPVLPVDGISYDVRLANVLMNGTYFDALEKSKQAPSLEEMLHELRDFSNNNEALKEFWPRLIAVLAMNKKAHTPFFKPNRMTLITKPFSPKVIEFIDQELEATHLTPVNGILKWIRDVHYVAFHIDAPRPWDVFCVSRRFAIVNHMWVDETFDSTPRTNNTYPAQSSVSVQPEDVVPSYNRIWMPVRSAQSVVENKHFPMETATLFTKQDLTAPNSRDDFIKQIVVARYLCWLYKAHNHGKKYTSFYPHKTSGDGEAVKTVDAYTPHDRVDDLSGPFPGRGVYQTLTLRGFKLPRVLEERFGGSLKQSDLMVQARRYYVDAAAQGLTLAMDFLKKHHQNFYLEHILPIDLKTMDRERALSILYIVRSTQNSNISAMDRDQLIQRAGADQRVVMTQGSERLCPPPSPRKTPFRRPLSAHNPRVASSDSDQQLKVEDLICTELPFASKH